MIAPGSSIGIVGGGQLGRMLAIAAAQLGYRCHIFAPDEDSVATEVAAAFTRAAYDDRQALARFAARVDVATYEFENLPVEPLKALGHKLHPPLKSLEVAQDRLAEKSFLRDLGVPTAAWRQVNDFFGLEAAVSAMGAPAILKTRRFGYDGKGQARLATKRDAVKAWSAIGGRPAVLEALVDFEAEFSILLCRAADGAIVAWDAVTNVHRDGILATSSAPPVDIVAGQAPRALAIAQRVANALDHVGVLTLEFFACAEGPIVNELAPRVHNSGHWTIEGARTSQFENHIRAVCGLPLGDTALTGAAVGMRNLIGPDADDWPNVLAEPGAHLHLYGKGEPRPGRKMGHVTRVTR